jgi:NAD(P)-dependent dehydrogenase (short-subunit alcohol dehydrogenase family)
VTSPHDDLGTGDRPWARGEEPGRRLVGKRALVTGAGTAGGDPVGIGEAIAVLFAAQGAQIAVVDISRDRAERTMAMIDDVGGEAMAVIGDLTDVDENARCVTEAAAGLGGLDTLVNNAAISGGGGSPVAVDLAEWDAVMRLNLDAAMFTARHAIPHLQAAGGGAIVNLTSVAAARAHGSGAYAAAKAALLAVTRDWAYAHGGDHIRVNCLAPGHAYTPMGQGGHEEVREARRRAGMLPTEALAWDIAWAAVFLASEESRMITAIELTVDAGTTARAPFGWWMRERRGS